MRLSKIKLSGFKSFVDPTTIKFPGNLVSILGPNGCGKSNTIDAVRWVMGESSARHLRGEAMTDVIFNGAASRKPVGQASVELLFDNSDGKMQGEYAKFNEVSIKRVVNRESQSFYYINNKRCRRKDVTDLFLGTGLGPRSYAIIEQGTISRLIESRPEELRVYIEEAAGISKYKERRRETENRIRHTRENLERLDDIRLELEKQLGRLQRQARTAKRYQSLRAEERLLKAQLDAILWRQLDQQAQSLQQKIRQQELETEEQNTLLRQTERHIEQHRQQHQQANDTFNRIQASFYQLGSEISRIEQSIEHARERQKQHQQDLQAVERSCQRAARDLENDEHKLLQIQQKMAELQPQLAQARQQYQHLETELQLKETAYQQWQQQWEHFHQQSRQPVQLAQIERNRMNQLEKQLRAMQHKEQQFRQEQENIQIEYLQQQLEEIAQKQAVLQQQLDESGIKKQQLQSSLEDFRQQIKSGFESLNRLKSALSKDEGQLASLLAVQQTALGDDDKQRQQWLQQGDYPHDRRLAQVLDVTEGWEFAVEFILHQFMDALYLQPDAYQQFILQLHTDKPEFALTALQKVASDISHHKDTRHQNYRYLADCVDQPVIKQLLDNIVLAENLQQAQQILAENKDDGSMRIVSRDGYFLGRNWVQRISLQLQRSGLLVREKQIKDLQQKIAEQQQVINSKQRQLDQLQQQLQLHEQEYQALEHSLSQDNQQMAQWSQQLQSRQIRLEHQQQRRQQLENECLELRQQIEQNQAETVVAEKKLHQALADIDAHEVQERQLKEQKLQLQEQLKQLRQQTATARDRAHQLEIQLNALQSEYQAMEQARQRIEGQLQGLKQRRKQLQNMLAADESPLHELQQKLDQKLEAKIDYERQLSQAREQLEQVNEAVKQAENKRTELEQSLNRLRSELEQKRILWQELKVKRQTFQESLDQSEFNLSELLLQVPENAQVESWQEQLMQKQQQIKALGTINLAAIEEYQEQQQRKDFLDQQNDDLLQALATLEAAISRIDRETRSKFKLTFDQVNNELKLLFPKLFGGGHAYLDLTGDDLLDTGVTIMARPPGKKNATIHLLSGGEKALTAVALVFAIFSLNPAPFCMLDEVDAPLDEANVGRFCSLVREMSQQVQFIYITHNKTTMEMSDYLCGVTMKEPGVSRVVDVDINEAIDMVEV